MQYNTEIKNVGALPVSYITKVGQAIAVDSLYKDKVLFVDLIHISFTPQNQILVHCNGVDYIFQPSADLEIVPRYESAARHTKD